MELSRSTMKKLLFLITFAALVFTFFQQMDGVGTFLRFLGGILAPFLVGGAIAFILNVPMRFLERKLFTPRPGKGKSPRRGLPAGLRRGLSLLLTFVLLLLVILVLVLVVVPELAATISSLSVTIQAAFARFRPWAEEQFSNNPQVVQWLEGLTLNWDSLISSVVDFLKNGAGSMLSSTISAAKSVVSGVTTAFVAMVFACYLLLQKERLALQCRKALYALLPQRAADRTVEICSLSHRVFSSFITGQGIEAVILGAMFFVVMSLLRMPYALLVGCTIAVTVGGSLMGVAGMLIFIPLTSVAYTLFREFVYRRLKAKGLTVK